MKKFLFLLVVIGLFAAWWQWGTANLSKPAASAAVPAAAPATPATTALPPSAVLNIDPKLGAGAGVAAVAASSAGKLPSTASPVLTEYMARKDYATLYNKLKGMPDNAEATFLRAQILDRCARKTDAAAGPAGKTPEERRAALVASLKPDAPDTARRLAAYDAINADPCGELRTVETTAKEIAELRAKAIEQKDAVALARELNCDIFTSASATGNRFPEINDSRVERIRAAMASRNPIAVRAGAGMLANTYRNGTFRIGPDGKAVDPQVMFYTANLLACQYGGDCTTDVLRACASDGKCDASNYNDYLSYYQLSPNDAQVAEQYRAWLTQMIDAGDFSRLQLVPGEQSGERVRLGSYFSCG